MARKQETKEKKEKYSISNTTTIEPKRKFNLESESSKFVVILLCIVAFICMLWLASTLKSDKTTEEPETEEIKINYTEVIVGNMLDQKHDNYLVYAYTKDVEKASQIEQLLYSKEHVYTLNLEKANNSIAMSDKSNFKGAISEIKFKGVTLLLINKGKIKEVYEGTEDIIKYLSK